MSAETFALWQADAERWRAEREAVREQAVVDARRGLRTLTRLIREAREVVERWTVAPSGPSLEKTAEKNNLQALAFDFLRRIIAVEGGEADPGRK